MSSAAPSGDLVLSYRPFTDLYGDEAVAFVRLMLVFNTWVDLEKAGVKLTLTKEVIAQADAVLSARMPVVCNLPSGKVTAYGKMPGRRIEREGDTEQVAVHVILDRH